MAAQSTYSLSSDGSGGYLALPFPALASGDDFTLSFWVKPVTSLSGFNCLFESANGSRGWALFIDGSGNKSFNGDIPNGNFGMPLTFGSWHHIAFVRDHTVGLIAYMDGVAGATASNISAVGAQSVVFGSNPSGGGSNFLGEYDDFAFIPSALSAAQIAAIAGTPGVAGSSSLDVATLSPVGLWRAEAGSGSTVADTSGNGNDGAISGGVTWDTSVPAPLQAAGIQFDAASNSLNQASASSCSWSHTCTGSSRFLAVDVVTVTTGSTPTSVSGVTYNSAAMSFLGGATVVSVAVNAYRVESWGLAAPASGSNTVAVTLSGTAGLLLGMAVSYTGVHQAAPTEAFASNSGLDAGAGVATVTVTTVADSDWVHAAITTDDVTISAGQTARSTVSDTGADEDTGPISPAASTGMTYTSIDLGASWAIVGYAIRPVGAVSGNFSRSFFVFQAVSAASSY